MTQVREDSRRHLVPGIAGVAALTALIVTGMAAGTGGNRSGLMMAASSQSQMRVGAPASGRRMALMRAAAREFGTPIGLLLAISG